MYYNSNCTAVVQPTIGADSPMSLISYIMKGTLDIFQDLFFEEQGINENVVGYNNEKREKFAEICSITHNSIHSLAKYHATANAALDDILNLDYNWNDHGAQAFSEKLVKRCRDIVTQLAVEPFVFPTACGSIQFEYEKDNGEYLEFEIYEDRIEVYSETLNHGEEEFTLCGTTATDKAKQMVVDFYG